MPRIVPYTRAQSGRGRRGETVTTELDLSTAWGLYDRQVRFVTSSALFSLFLGGVGSGKSHALTAWIIRRALANPNGVGALLGRTSIDLQTVLLPSLFDRLAECQENCGVLLVANYDKGNAKLRFVNGCVVYFRPFNRIAKVRGLTLTFAGADEVEWSEADPGEIWSVFTGRLRGPGPLPGLAFATSPNGLRGITKRFVDAQRSYMTAVGKNDDEAAAKWGRFNVVTSTSFHNPYLPDHYYDALKSMSARRYKQEVEGKVLKPMNSVWSLEARHIIPWTWRQHTGAQRAYGVDWGTQDHHVAVMAQIDNQGRWTVSDELVCDGIPRGQFFHRLTRWVDGHSQEHGGTAPALFGVDRAVPVENQKLQAYYPETPIRWMEKRQDQKVRTGIEHVRDMLDPYSGEPLLRVSQSLSHIVTGATAPLIPAMRGYCYHLDASGHPTTAPKKDNTNDHICDALRYMVSASANRPELHGGRTLFERPRAQPRDPGAYGVGRSDQQW